MKQTWHDMASDRELTAARTAFVLDEVGVQGIEGLLHNRDVAELRGGGPMRGLQK